MATNDKERKKPEDQVNKELPANEEKVKKKVIEATGATESNPDIEDPRLFSPLQEPDRPATDERISEKTKDADNSSD